MTQPKSSPTRRVVVVADMVGYSALAKPADKIAGADGVATMERRIERTINEALDETAAQPVAWKGLGDEAILVFADAKSAEHFAVELHKAMARESEVECRYRTAFELGLLQGSFSWKRTVSCEALPFPRRSGSRERRRAAGSWSVSMSELSFASVQRGTPRGLGDPFISRRPIRLKAASDGGVILDASDTGTSLLVGGEPLTKSRELSAQELDRGAALLLARRVALLLRRTEQMARESGPPVAPARQAKKDYRHPQDVGEDELLEALRDTGWNVTRAAERLNVARTTLNKLMDASPRVRKAKELGQEEIEAAMDRSPGNLEATAAALEVSLRGLVLRMRELGLR